MKRPKYLIKLILRLSFKTNLGIYQKVVVSIEIVVANKIPTIPYLNTNNIDKTKLTTASKQTINLVSLNHPAE